MVKAWAPLGPGGPESASERNRRRNHVHFGSLEAQGEPAACHVYLSITDSQWSLIFGQWSLLIGQWPLIFGQWSLISGQWLLINGRWTMVIYHWVNCNQSVVKQHNLPLTLNSNHNHTKLNTNRWWKQWFNKPNQQTNYLNRLESKKNSFCTP